MTEMNGKTLAAPDAAPAPPLEPTAGQAAAKREPQPVADPIELICAMVRPTLGFVITGMATTMRAMQPEVLLLGFTRAVARTIGSVYGGDVVAIAGFRKAIVEEFTTALLNAPIVPLPGPAAGETKPADGQNDEKAAA